MPFRELHKHYETYRVGFAFTPTASGSSGSVQLNGAVTGQSRYTIDAETDDYGIFISIGGAQGTGPNPDGTDVIIEIPILSYSDSWNLHATDLVAGNAYVEIDDLKVYYQSDDTWYATWGEIRVIVNDSTVDTIAGDDVTAPHGVPSGMPFIGIPFRVDAGTSFTPEPSLPAIPGSTSTTPGTTVLHSVEVEFEGEQLVEDAFSVSPEGFPVNISLPTPPSVECPCSPEPLPTLTCSNTSSFSGSSLSSLEIEVELVAEDEECPCVPDPGISAFRDVYANRLIWRQTACHIELDPDTDREAIRFDPDNHQETIYRGGMPRTYKAATTTCQTAFPATESGDVVTETVTTEVHPRQSEYLAGVSGTTHAFEDTLSYQFVASASKSSYRYTGTTYAFVTTGLSACPPGSSSVCPSTWTDSHCAVTQSTAFPVGMDDRTDNPDIPEYLDHVTDRARYVNTWGAPFWVYRPYFPPNVDEEGQSTWPIFGNPVLIEYWIVKGDQWQANGAAGETANARTTLISDPLLYKRVSPWGWGNMNFKVLDLVPLTSYTFSASNSGLFTLTDCTGSYASTIELTPDPGESTIVFEIALGTWNLAPYQIAHLAKNFTVGWVNTNIDNVLVDLVSHYGDVVELTDNVEGTFAKPVGIDTKYAGDHVQNYGAGYFTDQGADLRANGDSTATMADPERAHAFSLLGGRTAKAIRFTITVTDPDDPVELNWPSFETVTAYGAVFQLNRSNAAIVWEDGPGIRFGNTSWHHDGTHNQTPEVLPPGFPLLYPIVDKLFIMPTGTDVLSFENQFLLGEDFDHDFAAKIAANWDPLEATDATELDDLTIAFLIPGEERVFPRAVIINRCAVPPTSGMPQRGRDSDYVQNGTWKQEVYTHAVEPRFYVGDSLTHLQNPSDAVTWTTEITAPDPWKASKHIHAVNNEEGLFRLLRGAVAIGTLRPWNGGFSVRNVNEPEPGYPSLHTDVGLDGRRIRVWLDGDGIVRSDIRDGQLGVMDTIDHGIAADLVRVSIDRASNPQKVLLFTIEGGSGFMRESVDGGYSYGSPVAI